MIILLTEAVFECPNNPFGIQEYIQGQRSILMRIIKMLGITSIVITICLSSALADEPRQVKVPTFKPVSPQAVSSGNENGIQAAAGDCEAKKSSVTNTSIPSNASITSSQETVMFMTKTALEMIASGCPTEPGVTSDQIAQAKQQYFDAYNSAEQACNQVQSGDRKCSPRKHF